VPRCSQQSDVYHTALLRGSATLDTMFTLSLQKQALCQTQSMLALPSCVLQLGRAMGSERPRNVLNEPVVSCVVRTGGPNSFGVWSLRWSADGREIIAGTADCSVYVYDMDRRKARHRPLPPAALRIPRQDHGMYLVASGCLVCVVDVSDDWSVEWM